MPVHLTSRPFHWVITLRGERRTVRMLLVPARTHRMLATMVMRLAAQMPIIESPKEDEVAAALRIVMAA
ncbi:Hypothetical protein ERS075552_06668 [Mycobacteroides abscessus]|nr:Hypothetical protein ERS075552_06668 [Mycobacteroides abscessus]